MLRPWPDAHLAVREAVAHGLRLDARTGFWGEAAGVEAPCAVAHPITEGGTRRRAAKRCLPVRDRDLGRRGHGLLAAGPEALAELRLRQQPEIGRRCEPGVERGAEPGELGRMARIAGEVVDLVWVGLGVVELLGRTPLAEPERGRPGQRTRSMEPRELLPARQLRAKAFGSWYGSSGWRFRMYA